MEIYIYMSSRERLLSELSSLKVDAGLCLEYFDSAFESAATNSERISLAKEFLIDSGVKQNNMAKLLPHLSRLVIEFSESQASKPDKEDAIESKPKKNSKKVFRGKDIEQFFDVKGPRFVQQYSDDEGKNPKIVRNPPVEVTQTFVVRKPKAVVGLVVPRASPAAWKETPKKEGTSSMVTLKGETKLVAPVEDYGGFW